MHATPISTPVRTAMISGRFSSKALGSVAFPSNSTALYQTLSLRCQARPASTSAHVKALRPTLSAPCPHSQSQMARPVTNGVATMRTNSTVSEASRKEATKLNWNSFFQLRASRRRYSLASSIASSAASTVIGVQILSAQDLEHMGAQVMGLDPFVVLGMATAACGAVGWLIGPFVGNAVWGLVNRQYRQAFMIKEKEFYDRIKRFRVDPSSNSIANPVPDYYGEKIGSVQGYRQWLKDQRVYNRKRRNFIL
ncbi:TIM23 complex component [Aspergillus alliaceus]|uniref:Presequence translocated-associated motor subunit PAM17 n=1 Tax=Petromyces alliaceus TaxID=209559 RepID=A0A5N6FWZ2_PETAA|nr:mitochondrial import protein Pam17-domain-containing protein [Aspergillus alliaceus]KAB8233440.1 mitochondrial import protein Pam17-domain-containing protein [Aspergillus alliaceus]KAE8388272.1 mitochondrial import protein Pam17-domain-containing protein [Aspergillus alliaceus]KAF5866190.1 TIM23 complex component [Aspergillus burnettii]